MSHLNATLLGQNLQGLISWQKQPIGVHYSSQAYYDLQLNKLHNAFDKIVALGPSVGNKPTQHTPLEANTPSEGPTHAHNQHDSSTGIFLLGYSGRLIYKADKWMPQAGS